MTYTVSLRRRLSVALVLVFIFGLAVSMAFFYFQVKVDIGDLQMRTLRGQARDFLANLRITDDHQLNWTLPAAWAEAYAHADSGFFFTLYDAARQPLATSSNRQEPLPYLAPPRGEDYSRLQFSGVAPHPVMLVAARAPDDHVLVVGRQQDNLEAIAESLLEEDFEYLLLLVPFILVLALLGIISDWSLRPLARASREAERIGPANPDARIAVEGLPREAKPLIEAVNGALERLAHAYIAERRLTADAAHALRTPLAVLTLRLQKAAFDNAQNGPAIAHDLEELNRIVNQLLDLARKENPAHATSDLEPVNLARLVREAAAHMLPRIEQAGRQLEVDAPYRLTVLGRSHDLRDLVLNLQDNALVHGRGTIRITLGEGQMAGQPVALLVVSDQGPGIAMAERETIFERFYKTAPGSRGAGLGLAIVRQVAYGHGGNARVAPSAKSGIEVTLPLPKAPGQRHLAASEHRPLAAVTLRDDEDTQG
jgi:two-component system sensor histidine kinase QseC